MMYERYDNFRYIDYWELYRCLEMMTAESYLDRQWCDDFAAAMGNEREGVARAGGMANPMSSLSTVPPEDLKCQPLNSYNTEQSD